MKALAGLLVADLSRYLPGPLASRELLRLGARVVRIEPPDGDPVRHLFPEWDELLNAGKESVVCDLKAEPELARRLVARADVVLESFRPGVVERLGVGPDAARADAVYCSITGFGAGDLRAGHDLNYMGWAGALHTAPAVPPVAVADAAGAWSAVTQVLAALLQRERTGAGAHVVVSLTHAAHDVAPFGGEPLDGRLACYRIYECADGRHLTVAPLEPRFWARLCDLVGRPDLVDAHYGEDQEALAAELAAIFATRAEAAARYRAATDARLAPLGEHTASWRRELGLV